MRANVGRSVPTVGISPSGIKQHKLNGVHMKYTSLFSAVAIAAAMGTQALATVTTNDVNVTEGTFEAKAIGAAGTVLGGTWAVQNEDQSEVIYAPLSSQDAVDGYTANKHLKLNNEGNELVWNPGTVNEPKSIIEMKVRLVASDTAPAISAEDTTVHAAVYLQVSEPVDASNDGLYAYTATGWSKLDASFNAQLATGSMVALRVLMDYEDQTATYEGCVLTDAENDVPVYVNLGTKDMANPTTAQNGTLTSVGFKGTGGIDDLFVKEIEETPSTAIITTKVWDTTISGESQQRAITGTIDTVEAGSHYDAYVDFDETFEGLVVKSVTLFDTTNNVECTWTTPPTIDPSTGAFSVTMANFTFVAQHGYEIRIVVGEESSAPTYTGPKSNGIQILAAADEDAYETATGNTFVPLAFTSISVNGNVVTAAFNATVVNEGNETSATFVVAYKNALDGAEQTATGTVTLTNGGGTVVVELPEGSAHFLTGFSTPAPAAGN